MASNSRSFDFPFQQQHHDRNPNPFHSDFDDARSSNGDTVVDEHEHHTEAIDMADLSKSALNRDNDKKEDVKESKVEDDAMIDQDDPDAPYKHLPPHEAQILKDQVEVPEFSRSVLVLYSYATTTDRFIILISAICAIANGCAIPLMTIIFGGLQKTFSDFTVGKLNANDLRGELSHFVLYFVYLALGMFAVTYVSTVGFIYTGENITARIRQKYLESCLRQNIGFFDKIGAGEIVTRITSDTNLIQDGISEKVSSTISAIATFLASFVIGFANNPKLTAILSCVIFALIINSSIFSGYLVRNTVAGLTAAGNGADLAEEVLSSIRNAVAFGTQGRLAKKFDHHMSLAEYYGFRTKAAIGVMVGGMMLLLYLAYALAFWQGSTFLLNGDMQLNEVLVVMMSVTTGAFNMGNISPNFQAFMAAMAAAAKVFNTIYRVSPIDPFTEGGDIIHDLKGHIRLENIRHIYPSRPGVVVMDGVSLDVPAGKTTALVGASGSGKSTIVGLVERFYSPVAGKVYLDGRDITKLNLRWLRQQMALVSQEPTLFATTIHENIRFGLIGSKFDGSSEPVMKDLVIAAAKKANAHDFITALPEGYETNVGERGFLLSGGQKQRIAIARAIVSDPKILLLDEATSALDTKSEGVVQQALENASEGRTTITIAHRLSTIRDAHKIVVMSVGRIIESGTHDQLVASRGAYYDLVSAQTIKKTDDIHEEKQKAIDRAQNMHILRRSQYIAGNLFTGLEEEFDHKLTFTATEYLYNSTKAEEPVANYSIWTLLKFVASFNRTEWKRMLLGLFFSILCGGGNPVSAVFLAKEIMTLTPAAAPGADLKAIRHDAFFWAIMFIVLAVAMFITYAGQGITFASCSEHLMHRFRDQVFQSLLRQDIAFFDRDENSAGSLTSFLFSDTYAVAGLSGATLGTILLTLSTLVSSMVLALCIGWELALVCIGTIPVLLGCGFFRFYLLMRFQENAKAAYASSASYASEAVSAIRTVAALTREEDVLNVYRTSIAIQQAKNLKSTLTASIVFAASQGAIFLCFGLGFWYGGKLMLDGKYTLFQFFVVFTSVIYGAQSSGTIFSFAPDMGKANASAKAIKKLFDRVPTIDAWSQAGQRINKSEVKGHVEFKDVHFRYPTRPEQPILRGLDLKVKPGQYVALVGASGCGKSTTIGLLERFYDPIGGGVFVDGRNINDLNINDYRSCMALVSQEPTLYQGSVKDNILLGIEGDVSDAALEKACRDANIYDFIISLPDGFNTMVGSKGTLLSGGQKQRIAIARALIRNPKILLLDEATSALDSESEYIVQAALDKAAKGRTTIAIAHRLSTIQKADVIYVFDQGRVVERGSHMQLMRKKGRYAELVNLQSLEAH